nr:oligosaccharide flippase family protein [Siccirubricoccus soli]
MLIVLINVGTGLLTARLLGPEGRGELAAIIFWPQFLASLALAGLPYAVIYHLRESPTARREVMGASLVLGLSLGVVTAAIGAAVVPYTMHDGYSPAIVAFATASCALTLFNLTGMLLKSVLAGLDKQGLANRYGIADPGFYLVLLGLSALLWPMSPQLAAACMFTSGVTTLGVTLWRLRPQHWPRWSGIRGFLGPVGGFALRAAPGGLLANFSYFLDRIVLVATIAPEQLGLYAVAFALSRLMEVVKSTVASVGMAAMAGRAPEEAKALHDRVFRFVLLAVIVVIAGGFALGGPAIRLVYGNDFGPANILFRVLVIEAAVSCLGQVVAQLYFALGRPGMVSWAQGAGFTASLAAMLSMVGPFGAMGVAIGLTLGAVVRIVVLLAGVRRSLGMALPSLRPEPGEFRLFLQGLRRA